MTAVGREEWQGHNGAGCERRALHATVNDDHPAIRPTGEPCDRHVGGSGGETLAMRVTWPPHVLGWAARTTRTAKEHAHRVAVQGFTRARLSGAKLAASREHPEGREADDAIGGRRRQQGHGQVAGRGLA